ncbi:MAG TPA: helix-turn-helix domain-containing protein, partial [Candidatus Limnocylindrales bacterium]|nr:helix-turn-helix domain-containing protein [Candidatus Limnocylindrales bacterium]
MSEHEHHKLGDVLRAAREARGVDLARVERDTKIRARYLAALEQGDYRDLPGAVYTKGFLRNYGSYLNLDTDYLVDLYRLESSAAAVERPTVQAPPRPITKRRGRAFVITPGAVLAALLTVAVALFIVYLVTEFVTFAGTPDLRVTDPAGDLSGYDGNDYLFRGVTEPNARVTAETASRKTEVNADADGLFTITVPLRPGANVVTLVANDPLTGRDSQEVSRTILVGDAGTPAPSTGPQLVVAAPEDGATVTSPVQVSGSAPPNARLTLSATSTAAAAANFRVATLAGTDVSIPSTLPPAPDPLAISAGADGAFAASLALPPGTWQLSVQVDGGDAVSPVMAGVVVPPP